MTPWILYTLFSLACVYLSGLAVLRALEADAKEQAGIDASTPVQMVFPFRPSVAQKGDPERYDEPWELTTQDGPDDGNST